MNYRKLRIAWSLVCGFVCLLLVVLWVRSYWWAESYYVLQAKAQVDSRLGTFELARTTEKMQYDRLRQGNFYFCWSAANLRQADGAILGGLINFKVTRNELALPYWFVAMIPIALAAAPWLPLRFTLRTLLIAMTLVALLLMSWHASNSAGAAGSVLYLTLLAWALHRFLADRKAIVAEEGEQEMPGE